MPNSCVAIIARCYLGRGALRHIATAVILAHYALQACRCFQHCLVILMLARYGHSKHPAAGEHLL